MQRCVHLHEFLNAVILVGPRRDIRSSRSWFDRTLLQQCLHHGVVNCCRRQFERHRQCPTCDKWGNLSKTLDVLPLLLARCVAQVVEGRSMLTPEDIV